MFGFGDSKEREEEQRKAKELATWETYIPARMRGLYGTDDPEMINEIWRTYMPEITKAILDTEAQTSHLTDDHAAMFRKHDEMIKNTHEMHDEMMTEIRDLKQQNKDLQEKFNAMMDLLARQAEKENGKGR